MFTLCIVEQYYILGLYRLEAFYTMRELQAYRQTLNRTTQSWIQGVEQKPERKRYSVG